MNQTCHKCGYTGDYLEFAYLCKNGCPACGESDLRSCPKCGAHCVFSRAESLEEEEGLMRELSMELSQITKDADPATRDHARRIISRLREMNLRWNIPELSRFLLQRQKELFY
ncbi:MAG TPA: hypothetical protein ENN34_01680 [Deltaproteobacteria bacterium]|nr:hypothetical protein [Desulfomonilia bacterium]HDP24131.1 hypothetical protein [Deltaproteobacteria bacterium]